MDLCKCGCDKDLTHNKECPICDMPSPPSCKWGACDGYWETQCDHEWHLPEGTPKENGMNYCPMCGKPLEQREECNE